MKSRSKSPFPPEMPFSPQEAVQKPKGARKAASFGDALAEPAARISENTRIREIAERQLLYDVAELSSQVRSEGLGAALTGGLATRAYAGPIRFTHDADMVVVAGDCGKLKRVLKDMGYRGHRKPFGKGEILFATRHVEDRHKGIAFTLKIDVSVGGIYDHSSGILYQMSERIVRDARNLPIRGYFPSSFSVIVAAQVVSLEDLFLLKAMTLPTPKNGREKDTIDALLLALKNPPDLIRVWETADRQGISEHICNNIERKLLSYLSPGSTPLMESYGLSFSGNDEEVIRAYLVSLLAHRTASTDPKNFL